MVVVNNLAVLVFLLKFSLSNAYFQEIMAHNHIHIRSQRKWGKVCSSDLTIILGSFSPCPLNYFLVFFLFPRAVHFPSLNSFSMSYTVHSYGFNYHC